MNLKKFISGVSALAIAASAFAGMAVTANAGYTFTSEYANEGLETYNCVAGDTKIAGQATGTIGNLFYSLANAKDGVFYSEGNLVRLEGPNASRYVTYTAPSRGQLRVFAKPGARNDNSKLSYTVIENTTTGEILKAESLGNTTGSWDSGNMTVDAGNVIKIYMPTGTIPNTEYTNGGALFINSITFKPSNGTQNFVFTPDDAKYTYNAVSATFSKTDADGEEHSATLTAPLDTNFTGGGDYYIAFTRVPLSVSISGVTLTSVD